MPPSPEQLSQLTPFELLNPASLAQACEAAEIIDCPKDTVIFRRGEPRTQATWLIKGTIDLVDANYETTAINEQHTKLIDSGNDFKTTAIATSDCQVIVMPQDTLDLIITVDQVAEEQNDEDDWMTRLLSSRLFEFVPPADIQALFKQFSAVNYGQGDEVITQGDDGDFFYVIKHGKASIDRMHNDGKKHLKVIGPGDFFGEDALISDKKRNATITMLERGELMRLGKEEFNHLLVKPASESVTLEEVRAAIKGGEQRVKFIDVRHPTEIDMPVEGARNIPLQLLRQKAEDLDPETVYVVATPGRRAELGALLLTQAGFDSYILKQV